MAQTHNRKPETTVQSLSPQQKATVILGLLGKDSAKPVLDHLEVNELRVFGQTMATLGDIDQETVIAVVKEFVSAVGMHRALLQGSLQNAFEMLAGNIDESVLNRLRLDLDETNAAAAWQTVSAVDAEILAEILALEHAQVAAIVLTKIPADKAATIFNLLDSNLAQKVITLFNQSRQPEPSFVDDVGRALAEKFARSTNSAVPVPKPALQLSAMLDLVAGSVREGLLNHLQTHDPEFTREVRNHMFTFADLPARVDNRDIAKIARAVDQGILLKALAGASATAPDVLGKILDNISSRLADQLKEALTELGEVKVHDAEAAQTEIIKAVRMLEKNGDLQLLAREES